MYFNNLKMVKAAADKAGIPFQAIIGTGVDYSPSTVNTTELNTLITGEMLAWNANTPIAYGAKGISWFTLVQPTYVALHGDDGSLAGIDPNRSGLIGADGSTNWKYDAAKSINAWLASVDHILMDAEHVGVIAFGTQTQKYTGATDTYDDTTLCAYDGTVGAFAGVFEYNGKTAYYIVNNDMVEEQAVALDFGVGNDKDVTVYTADEVYTDSTNYCEIMLTAGAAALVVVG
jgi:hypothetical protein